MTVYRIDPLQDPRWEPFLQAHPRASVFHSRAWLESLRRAYGYTPFALTTSGPHGDLTNGLVFCRVSSWLTGKRFVSVPFADHCEPLFENIGEFHAALDWLRSKLKGGSRAHAELRPVSDLGLYREPDFRASFHYSLHTLDLRPDMDQIMAAFDRESVRRRLRRHVATPLDYEEGNTPALLEKFYQLQVLTRRRHRIPPQPRKWFDSLMAAMGDSAKIRAVSKSGSPVAAILTLQYKDTVVYKYGCSDVRFNNLSGTVFLFWRAIQEAKEAGTGTFDMGRSDVSNHGLIAFKSHWGATETPVTYWRSPGNAPRGLSARVSGQSIGGRLVSVLPDRLLIFVGKNLYKHVG